MDWQHCVGHVDYTTASAATTHSAACPFRMAIFVRHGRHCQNQTTWRGRRPKTRLRNRQTFLLWLWSGYEVKKWWSQMAKSSVWVRRIKTMQKRRLTPIIDDYLSEKWRLASYWKRSFFKRWKTNCNSVLVRTRKILPTYLMSKVAHNVMNVFIRTSINTMRNKKVVYVVIYFIWVV